MKLSNLFANKIFSIIVQLALKYISSQE